MGVGLEKKPVADPISETPSSGPTNTVTELEVNGIKIKIPASQGKIGIESATTGLGLERYCSEADKKWYINMRWPSQEWRWDGANRGLDETLALYGGKKIIVYNPTTKKSVVAIICESGPAPWTGSSWYTNTKDQEIGPDFWKKGTVNEWHQFDPPEADGRVAGLAPDPFNAIGANINDILNYGFAADQNITLGPLNTPN